MHQSSYKNMLAFKEKYLEQRRKEKLLIVDLGSCDVNGSYKKIFDHKEWKYVGLDAAPGKNVDMVLENPYHWKKIATSSVDVLISGQAFEHIEYFWITMLEIARVLKPGGICVIIAPSGGFEHRYPVDCWRFYPDGFGALARFARLGILEHFTCWDPDPELTDDSHRWKDSVLISQKPVLKFAPRLKETLRRSILHKILILGI